MNTNRIPLKDRILNKLVEDPNGCMIWQGYTIEGYGRINEGGKFSKKILVHRALWEIYNGPIPEGKLVRHTCDNRRCCNLKHLILGTHQDNSRDAVSRGRIVAHKGEAHHNSKLTKEDILSIRRLYKDGKSLTELGKDFDVTMQNIYLIVNKKSWSHI